MKKTLIVIAASLILLPMSCSKNQPVDGESRNPYLREGIIKLYSKDETLVYSRIVEYPYVEFSSEKMSYDTVGFAYTGYMTDSFLGSINLIVLYDDLHLYYVEYCYPMNGYGVGFARYESETGMSNPLRYEIKEVGDSIRGHFKGNLYPGGSYSAETEPFIIDSCYFQIHK